MNLRQMEYLLAIVETKNISRALLYFAVWHEPAVSQCGKRTWGIHVSAN